MENFVAVDFETALGKRYSACAVGIVVVKNSVISEKFWTLIQPPFNEYFYKNIEVHGITPEMTKDAQTFDLLYPKIREYLNGNIVICHNAEFDMSVLSQTMEYYKIIDDSLRFEYHCTMKLCNGNGLFDCCKELNIPLSHHDALSDAEACARLYLYIKGATQNISVPKGIRSRKQNFVNDDRRQRISGDLLKCVISETTLKENPFFSKKVVISGTYEYWPDRTILANLIKDLGADIDSSVTERTNFLIAGKGVGPSKFEKMMKNIEKGHEACIIEEETLIKILASINN